MPTLDYLGPTVQLHPCTEENCMFLARRFTAPLLGLAALVATFTLGSGSAHAFCPSYGSGMNYASFECYLDAMSVTPYVFTDSSPMPSSFALEDETYCVNFVCAPGYASPGFSDMLFCDSMGTWICTGDCSCTELPCSGTPVAPTGYVYGSCSGTTPGSTCPVTCDAGYTGPDGQIVCHLGAWSTPGSTCTVALCSVNQHVLNHVCVACAPGSTRSAGDDPTGSDTVCAPTLCVADQYVLNHPCTACLPGSTRPAGDDATGSNTACAPTICGADQYVSNHTCTACAPGSTRPAGDFATGADTTCTPTLCEADQYVENHVCLDCPAGASHPAGDDATGADTNCTDWFCGADQHVADHACVACAPGSTRPAGDNATGADTACTPTLCEENHAVEDHACVA
ncbi:MAG: hypothetical protein CVU59_07260, partial [Deltaproteobacteria bacterium HGW-Deltaproteobacteria-17]